MTPINSMLPIAAAGAENASGEGAAETSPLAGFGELIAGLILQGEASLGTSSEGEDGEGQPDLTEGQVATAMLLTSLSTANEQPSLVAQTQPTTPGADLEAEVVDETPDAGLFDTVPPITEGTAVALPSETTSVDGLVGESNDETLPPAQPQAPGEPKGLATPEVGDHLAPVSDPMAAQAQSPATTLDGGQVRAGSNSTPAQPSSSSADSEVGTTLAPQDTPQASSTPTLGDPSRSNGHNPTPVAAQPTVIEQSGIVPNSAATGERQVAPSPTAESPTIPTGSVGTIGDQPRPSADIGANPAAPTVVPPSQPSAVAVPASLVARVEQAIEMIENAPPPRQITIEADDLDGVRLTVALRPDGVSVSSQTADSNVLDAIERALAARGFDLSDSGRDRRRPADQDDQDGWRPPAAPRARQESRDQGIRL
jgi:hypothetical protein